jgi:geranylgeranyl diphosphate synthase type II
MPGCVLNNILLNMNSYSIQPKRLNMVKISAIIYLKERCAGAKMEKQYVDIIREDKEMVDLALASLAAEKAGPLATLISAEEYSLAAGGKRIRPVLVLEFCRLFGGDVRAALPYAVALEMVHTASLIHDDLPAIDNDDLRRGKPTSHKVYGEAVALLAADGLFIDAFAKAAANPYLPGATNAIAVKLLSEAAGTRGMVGGEYIDVASEGKEIERELLLRMHELKTGALIRGACMLGALAAGVGVESAEMHAAKLYAERLGLAFQITDDVLDKVGTVEQLGKTPGSDEAEGKVTFLSFMSVEEAMGEAERLTREAESAIADTPGAELLISLARDLVKRSF